MRAIVRGRAFGAATRSFVRHRLDWAVQAELKQAAELEKRLGRKLSPGETPLGPGDAVSFLQKRRGLEHVDPFASQHAELPKGIARRSERQAERRRRVEAFSLTPRQVKEHLDLTVIGQDEAKRALAVALCNHFNFVRHCLTQPEAAASRGFRLKPNVLLLGPSGVGKTHLMRAAAQLLGVPFVRADATRFSATGYVGADVDEMVRALLQQAEGDVRLAECGIVYVDEVDKLAAPSAAGGAATGGGGGGGGGAQGVNTRDVQAALLRLMEDAEVPIGSNGAPPRLPGGAAAAAAAAAGLGSSQQQPSTLSTKHVLFIFSGAFAAMERALGARTEAAGAAEAAGTLGLACTADLVRFGLEPEFVGRIPVRVALSPLGEDELLRVLTDAHCGVTAQLVGDFASYGIALSFTECALREVAAQAARQGTGARGLMTILEAALRPFNFELPSNGRDGTPAVSTLRVDGETVRRPREVLQRLLRESQS